VDTKEIATERKKEEEKPEVNGLRCGVSCRKPKCSKNHPSIGEIARSLDTGNPSSGSWKTRYC